MSDQYGEKIGEALGLGPNDDIYAQSEGEIEHPHYHSGQDSGDTHVDAHHITTDEYGNVSSEKVHDDDWD
jgi:hypothetical protein